MAKRRKRGGGDVTPEPGDSPPFHRPLQELRGLRDALRERDAAAGEAAADHAPDVPSGPDAEPPDADFEESMERAGVEPLESEERGRVARRSEHPAGPVTSRSPPVASKRRDDDEEETSVDDEKLAELLGFVRSFDSRAPPRSRDDLRELPLLDLHGFAVEDAVHAVRAFVDRHLAAGQRELRVVTGRGRHSAGDAPIRDRIE